MTPCGPHCHAAYHCPGCHRASMACAGPWAADACGLHCRPQAAYHCPCCHRRALAGA